jgi:hypothetical protein
LSPTPEPAVQAAGQGINLRAGPGTVYDIVGGLPSGASLSLLARTIDGSWYQVDYRGRPAWLFAGLVTANRELDEIPVASAIPPPPTPMPTATPVPPTATPTPVYVAPLSLSHSIAWVTCKSDKRYTVRFNLNVTGGTGTHAVYRDIDSQVVYGPGTERDFGYDLEWGAGYAAVGTLYVRSGDMYAESKFYVNSPDCKDYSG